MISPGDGKKLLDLTRHSIITYFSGTKPEEPYLKEKYFEKQGVFVTLHKNGRLRGCIGYSDPILPLYHAIIDAARGAAFSDPRFPPVDEEELADIKLEISILTIPKLIHSSPEQYPHHIVIGRDGLIIKGRRSGLLLPQVATEWGFDQITFLDAVSEKAGMEKDAWKDPEQKIYTFMAQIFKE